MAGKPAFGQRGVFTVNSDFSLFAAFPANQVFGLDSGVHCLGVRKDFTAFPRGTVRVRIGFQPRTAAPAPKREKLLPGRHPFAIVCKGANILELLIKHEGGPCHVSFDCGDGALATTARRKGLSDGYSLRLQGFGKLAGGSSSDLGSSAVRAPLDGLELHLHRGQSGVRRS